MTLARHKKVKKVLGSTGEFGVTLVKKSAPTSRAKRLPNLTFNLPVDKDGNPVYVKKKKGGKGGRASEPMVGIGKVREWVDAFDLNDLPTCGIPTAPPSVKIKNLEDLAPIPLDEAGKLVNNPLAAGPAAAVAAEMATAVGLPDVPDAPLPPSQAVTAAPMMLKRMPGESVFEYNRRITASTVDKLREIQLEMDTTGGFRGENKTGSLEIPGASKVPRKRSERKKERKKELKAAKQARLEAKIARKQPGYDAGDAAYKEEADRRAKEVEAREKLTAPQPKGRKPDLLSYHEKQERKMEKEREEARAKAATLDNFAAPKGLTKLEAKYAKPDRPGFGEVAHRPPELLSFSRKDKSRVPAGLRINEGVVKKLKGGNTGKSREAVDPDREKAIALYRELKAKKSN